MVRFIFQQSGWPHQFPLAALSYDGMSMNTRNETAYIPIKWAIKEYSLYKKREKLAENLQHVKSTILEQIQTQKNKT